MEDKYETATLAALQAIATTMEAQTAQLTRLAVKVDDVHDRVIRLEEQRHGRDIDRIAAAVAELKGRVSNIEIHNAGQAGQITGAGKMANAARLFLPLVIAAFFAIASFAYYRNG